MWKEEQAEYKTQVRENELKMWKAMDEKEWKETQETPPSKEKTPEKQSKKNPQREAIKELKILNRTLRVAFWNAKGMAHVAGRQKLVHYTYKENIDILFMSEAHINTNSMEKHDDYIFMFSTNVTAEQIKNAESAKEEQLKTGKGKSKGKDGGDSNIEIHNISAEKLGTAIIHKKDINPFLIDYILHDNRNISIQMKGKIGMITITGTHAPHAEATPEAKDNYYAKL